MTDKNKIAFVTTREPGTYALKISDWLPDNAELIDGRKCFRAFQSGFEVCITHTDDGYVYRHVEVYDTRFDQTYNFDVQCYDVLLLGADRLQPSIVDEGVFQDMYDLGSAAITRKEYEILKQRYKEAIKDKDITSDLLAKVW